MLEGWRCPVCGCGNAPQAMVCGKCAPETLPVFVPVPSWPSIPPIGWPSDGTRISPMITWLSDGHSSTDVSKEA